MTYPTYVNSDDLQNVLSIAVRSNLLDDTTFHTAIRDALVNGPVMRSAAEEQALAMSNKRFGHGTLPWLLGTLSAVAGDEDASVRSVYNQAVIATDQLRIGDYIWRYLVQLGQSGERDPLYLKIRAVGNRFTSFHSRSNEAFDIYRQSLAFQNLTTLPHLIGVLLTLVGHHPTNHGKTPGYQRGTDRAQMTRERIVELLSESLQTPGHYLQLSRKIAVYRHAQPAPKRIMDIHLV